MASTEEKTLGKIPQRRINKTPSKYCSAYLGEYVPNALCELESDCSPQGHKSNPKTLMGTYATTMESSEAVRYFGIVHRSVEPEVLKERQEKRELMMHEKKLIAARDRHRIHNKFMVKKLEKRKKDKRVQVRADENR